MAMRQLSYTAIEKSPLSGFAPGRVHETLDQTVNHGPWGSHCVPVGPMLRAYANSG